MLVKNWMSAPPITIDMNDSMQDAIKLIRENSINMLPVINKQRLVGVVTDGDLKRASASDATTLEIHELLYLLTEVKVLIPAIPFIDSSRGSVIWLSITSALAPINWRLHSSHISVLGM